MISAKECLVLLIGCFSDKKNAKVFSNFLKSKEIENKVEQHQSQHEVWIINETYLEQAKLFFADFNANPNDVSFHVKLERKTTNDTAALHASYRKNFKRAHGNSISWALIVIVVLAYLFSLIDQNKILLKYCLIALPSVPVLQLWLYQPWRLFSPVLLHFSIFQLLFNGYMLYYLGSFIEKKNSRIFYCLLLFFSIVLPNIVQMVFSGFYFGGLSGVVYALFGFLWVTAKYNPWSGYYLRKDIIFWMLGWLVLSFIGWLGHAMFAGSLAGLVVGGVFALVKRR